MQVLLLLRFAHKHCFVLDLFKAVIETLIREPNAKREFEIIVGSA
jgi:hypothetical protein